jgi:hypothetical protein
VVDWWIGGLVDWWIGGLAERRFGDGMHGEQEWVFIVGRYWN